MHTHHHKFRKYWFLAILVFFILIFAIVKTRENEPQPGMQPGIEQADVAARNVVLAFGSRMKEVSLLAEEQRLRQDITKAYKSFVTETLLKRWQDDPSTAPGRATSSPWPETIEILEMTRTDVGYMVKGNIVLMTSVELQAGVGNAGVIPVELLLVDAGDGWRIQEYRESAPATNGATDVRGETTVSVQLDTTAQALGLTIVPMELVEDSRCVVDVQCIWAGTLKIRTRLIAAGSANATTLFILNEPLVWNGYTTTLIGSDPKKSTDGDRTYSYIFTVKR